MRVSLNCKKKVVDYNGDYRTVLKNRAFARKSFTADMNIGSDGRVTFTKEDDGRVIQIDPADVTDIAFFLDEDRPYAEIVRERGGFPMSFVYSPVEDNIELGQQGVFSFREQLDDVAGPAGAEVGEYIDPNPLGICPDGVDSMEELIAIREAELNGENIYEEELDLSMLMLDEDANISEDIDDEAPDTEEIGDVVDNATAYLEKLQQQIEDEKARRLEEIDSLVNGDMDFAEFDDEIIEGDDEDFVEEDEDFVDEYEEEEDEGLSKIDEADVPAIADLLDKISESDIEEKESISERLGKLDDAAKKIGASLEDYDDLLATSRSEQEIYLAKLANSEEGIELSKSNAVAGLVRMLQEQTDFNESLNDKLKKERVQRRHCVEQLDAANQKIEEQAASLDEVRRRLRFSQENQRKSEKFVADARGEIRRIISETSQKVAAALEAVEEMKKQVSLKDAELQEAKATTTNALEAKAAAEKAQEELHVRFEDEKANNEKIVQEFSRQLDEFTNETISKIKSQIERADEAERKYAEKTVRIAELERDLADTKNQMDQVEIDKSSAVSDLLGSQESYQDLVMEYESLKKAHDKQGDTLSDTQALLDEARSEIEALNREFDNYKSDAAADLENLRSSMNAEYDGLHAKFDEQVSLTAAAEAALSAAEDRIKGMSTDYDDLKVRYDDQVIQLDDSGELLNHSEAELVAARGEIAQLNRDMESMRLDYESRIAGIEATRTATETASAKLLDDIRGINNMSSSFGSRKRKLEAVEDALNAYIGAINAERSAAMEAVAENIEAPSVYYGTEDAEAVVDDTDDESTEIWEGPTAAMPPIEYEDADVPEAIDTDVVDGYDETESFNTFDTEEIEQITVEGEEEKTGFVLPAHPAPPVPIVPQSTEELSDFVENAAENVEMYSDPDYATTQADEIISRLESAYDLHTDYEQGEFEEVETVNGSEIREYDMKDPETDEDEITPLDEFEAALEDIKDDTAGIVDTVEEKAEGAVDAFKEAFSFNNEDN